MTATPRLAFRMFLAAGLSVSAGAGTAMTGCVGDVGKVVGTGGVSGSGSGAAKGGTGGLGASGNGGHFVGGSGGSTGGSSGGTPGSGGATGSGGTVNPGETLLPARIRRLTNREYDASVQALLGTGQTMAVSSFGPDSRQSGYTVNDAQRVDPVLAKQLSDSATALVSEARGNGKLAALAPCANAVSGGEACATTFIQAFGGAAYRRPLTGDEVASLVAIYHVGADGAAYSDGIDLTVRAILQSAGFLYVTEIGDGTPVSGATVTLTPNETATTLAMLLTSAPADSALLAAATAGQLSDPAVREQHARRLLATTSAQSSLVRVVREWLGIDTIGDTAKDTTVYPQFSAVKDAMSAESQSFVREVLVNSTGTVNELLSANWTVADPSLATIYGVKGAATGRTSLAGVGRRGILNQGAFLSVYAHASETAPVFRGVAIMRRVACMALGSPTELNIAVTPPMPDPTKTTRARFAAHVSDPLCAGCHDSIDSIGFAFEKYDGMGMARPVVNGQAMENNQPVDTSTTLGDKSDERKTDFDGAYADSDALSMAMSNSAQVRTCMARQLFRSSAGRSDSLATGAENDFVTYWNQLPVDKQGNIIETMIAYVKNPTFTERRAQ